MFKGPFHSYNFPSFVPIFVDSPTFLSEIPSISFSAPSLYLDTAIYSVHCCLNRPLFPGVGIITELPSRLIGLEPAITSVLLEYTDTNTDLSIQTRAPSFDSVISISKKKATLTCGFSDTVGAQ